ncbi:hypothetical protein DFH28DRAFT_1095517 [Melampsora americana]|nr:hypothetical protein DFH28DRAFT_1095517 [Melampsora americana]
MAIASRMGTSGNETIGTEPIEWLTLSLLIEFQSIRLSIEDIKSQVAINDLDNQENELESKKSKTLENDDLKKVKESYRLANSLLIIITDLLFGLNPDRPIEFHKESPIGLYIRRSILNISTLEFDQLLKVFYNLKKFCTTEENHRSSSTLHLDQLTKAYTEFKNDYHPDFIQSANALRRFYDTRSHSHYAHLNSSIHSHALFSLAEFHYQNRAYPAAYDALDESTRLARLSSDRAILDRSTSLRRRLDHYLSDQIQQEEEQPQPIITGPTQAQSSLQSLNNHPSNQEREFWDPNEELFDVIKAIDRGEESLGRIYAKLFKAKRMTLQPSTIHHILSDSDPLKALERKFDQLSWFGLKAKLWYLQGQHSLCKVYEDLALSMKPEEEFDEKGLMSKTTILCDRAIRLAERGSIIEGLIILVEESIKNECSAHDFERVHDTIFDLLKMKASKEGNLDRYFRFEKYRPGLSLIKPSRNSIETRVHELCKKSEKLMEEGQLSQSLCTILSSMSLSDQTGLRIHRSKSLSIWAEVMIRLNQEVPVEILNQDEDRFHQFCLLKARLKIFDGLNTLNDLMKTLDYLSMATIHYKKIQDFKMIQVCESYKELILKEGEIKFGIKLKNEKMKFEEVEEKEELRLRLSLEERLINGLSWLSAKRFSNENE